MLTASSGAKHPQPKSPKQPPFGNQRIIKIHGSPQVNHFHGHHKHIRNRPFGGQPVKGYPKDEFIRPNHPPPIPPFFNGLGANHIKHLPRPPPHVYYKLPSYGEFVLFHLEAVEFVFNAKRNQVEIMTREQR